VIIIETGNEFVDEFVSLVDKKLKKARHKLRLVLGSGLYIAGSKVEGFYCEDTKELAICIDDGLDWVSTLAHEYNHFLQKQNKSKYWQALSFDGKQSYDLFWNWIEKDIELSKDELEMVVRKIQDVEYECECMTIKTIDEFNLPINMEEYILSSNSYLYFFQYAKKYRTWYGETGSPKNDHVYCRLPKTKMADSYYYLPPEWDCYFAMSV